MIRTQASLKESLYQGLSPGWKLDLDEQLPLLGVENQLTQQTLIFRAIGSRQD